MKKGITALAGAAVAVAMLVPASAPAAPTAESSLVCAGISIPHPTGAAPYVHIDPAGDADCTAEHFALVQAGMSNCPFLAPTLASPGLAGTCPVSASGYKGTLAVGAASTCISPYTLSAKKVKKKKGKKKKVSRLNYAGSLLATRTATTRTPC